MLTKYNGSTILAFHICNKEFTLIMVTEMKCYSSHVWWREELPLLNNYKPHLYDAYIKGSVISRDNTWLYLSFGPYIIHWEHCTSECMVTIVVNCLDTIYHKLQPYCAITLLPFSVLAIFASIAFFLALIFPQKSKILLSANQLIHHKLTVY